MNSEWNIPNFARAPSEYDPAYFDRLIKELEHVLRRARAIGNVRAQNVNISDLPTSSVGLRSGDLWNDSNTVKVVS
jgi:hypothetical protein